MKTIYSMMMQHISLLHLRRRKLFHICWGELGSKQLKRACGADLVYSQMKNLWYHAHPLCFCVVKNAGKTARSTVTAVWSRTAGWPPVKPCRSICCIWARSMTTSSRHGARVSRSSAKKMSRHSSCFCFRATGRKSPMSRPCM